MAGEALQALPPWARLVAGQLRRDTAHPAAVTKPSDSHRRPAGGRTSPEARTQRSSAHGSDQAQTRL